MRERVAHESFIDATDADPASGPRTRRTKREKKQMNELYGLVVILIRATHLNNKIVHKFTFYIKIAHYYIINPCA